ncbi:hypothetical protein ACFW88_30665 [Streptomyces anandii]|uniref:Uncharacterized protein n=1 Tax=Streptomyces anandii TaxID=285454 RepID=A0ABW6HE02_9ACTN
MSGDAYGAGDGFSRPPVPPMPARPPAPPPAPPDALRAAAVALLNLTGLGLGYALVRRWAPAASCWAATGLLLWAALPADPDGVPAGALVAYAVFLVLAAAHGALLGLRHSLAWPGRSPLALLLAVLLLAVPAAGGLLYDRARDEATEQMLLDRLDRADRLVREGAGRPFATAEPGFREALGVYGDLRRDHPGSRAARRVPQRMTAYYDAVASPYTSRKYCDAIAPLKYLRTVPGRLLPSKDLGALATWPDGRLAASLYACGADGLAAGTAGWAARFGELLTSFPHSEQATRVEPAVRSAVDRAAGDVRGGDPCTAVSRLRGLGSQISGVTGGAPDVTAALGDDAGRAGRAADSGTYACGVDQYRDGDFGAALSSMNEFVDKNAHDPNRARAQKIAIAAEIAETVPAAGKHLPTTASGGSIQVTVKNDSPDDITVLYTGPVTGSLTIKACGDCTAYPFGTSLGPGFHPCADSGKNYPQRTISLPPGTTYFLHKPRAGGGLSSPASDTARLRPGYIYTECAYTTKGLGTGT